MHELYDIFNSLFAGLGMQKKVYSQRDVRVTRCSADSRFPPWEQHRLRPWGPAATPPRRHLSWAVDKESQVLFKE